MPAAPRECNVLVVGDDKVGKSTLVSLLTDSEPPSRYSPTKKRKITPFNLNQNILFRYIELPGAQSGTSLEKAVKNGVDFCLLVYDTTRLDSWEQCIHQYFPHFSNQTNKLLLLGTKLDLEKQRQVPLSDVENFARKNAIFWMELTHLGQNVPLTKSILSIRANHWLETIEEQEKLDQSSQLTEKEQTNDNSGRNDSSVAAARSSLKRSAPAMQSNTPSRASSNHDLYATPPPRKDPKPTQTSPPEQPSKSMPTRSDPHSNSLRMQREQMHPASTSDFTPSDRGQHGRPRKESHSTPYDYHTPLKTPSSSHYHHHQMTPQSQHRDATPSKMVLSDIRSLGADLERYISDYSTKKRPLHNDSTHSVDDTHFEEHSSHFSRRDGQASPAPQQLNEEYAADPKKYFATRSPEHANGDHKQSFMSPPAASHHHSAKAAGNHQNRSPAASFSRSRYRDQQQQPHYNRKDGRTPHYDRHHQNDYYATPEQPKSANYDAAAGHHHQYHQYSSELPSSSPVNLLEDFLSPQNQYVPSHYDKISLDIGNITSPPPVQQQFQSPSRSSQTAYIKSFKETNDGNLIPIFGVDLQHDSPSRASPPSTRGSSKNQMQPPKIHLDINIGDGRTGQLVIRPGDNVLQLSQMFAKAFNLKPAYVPYLAHLIRTSTSRYIKKQKQKSATRTKKAPAPVSEVGFSPFKFQTEARAKIKKMRQPIVKMQFELPGAKTGVIVVRKGDNPHALAKNFCLTYGLSDSMMDNISSKIQQQLYSYYNANSTEDGSLARSESTPKTKAQIEMHMEETPLSEHRPNHDSHALFKNGYDSVSNQKKNPAEKSKSKPKKPKVLFNMEVELEQDRHHTFPITEGANPDELASNFCAQHGLGRKHHKILRKLIERNIENFMQSNGKTSRV